MRILFTGHRDKTCDPKSLAAILANYPDAVWVHGGAVGFDSQVEQFARAAGIRTEIHKPDYKTYGKSAPLRRNDSMVESCDMVVALYDGRGGGGTKYTIDKARDSKKTIIIL